MCSVIAMEISSIKPKCQENALHIEALRNNLSMSLETSGDCQHFLASVACGYLTAITLLFYVSESSLTFYSTHVFTP